MTNKINSRIGKSIRSKEAEYDGMQSKFVKDCENYEKNYNQYFADRKRLEDNEQDLKSQQSNLNFAWRKFNQEHNQLKKELADFNQTKGDFEKAWAQYRLLQAPPHPNPSQLADLQKTHTILAQELLDRQKLINELVAKLDFSQKTKKNLQKHHQQIRKIINDLRRDREFLEASFQRLIFQKNDLEIGNAALELNDQLNLNYL